MNDLTILCRNCNKFSINNYHGFCSISCFTDFAHRYNLSWDEAMDCSDGVFQKHRDEVEKLEEEVNSWKYYFEDEEREKDGYREAFHRVESENEELKKRVKNQEGAIQTLEKERKDFILAIKKLRHYDERFKNMDF